MIDAEGFDFEAVSLFPFDVIKPKAIIFEYKHLLNSELEILQVNLDKNGYKPFYAKNDVLFILSNS